jgi:Lycopene cyclase
VIFGFSFGGVASVLYSTRTNKYETFKPSIDIRNVIALSPVLIVSIGLYVLFNVNMMISLPLGLLTGCLLIITIRPDLTKKLLYSGLYFGLLYFFVLFVWLLLFPQAKQWWDLTIYGNITILEVPLGEVLFGFLFSAFWGSAYEFIFSYKLEVTRLKANN